MALTYPREAMQRRICEAVEAGGRLAELERRPGWPSRQTVYRWTLDDAGFADRLKAARTWRRSLGVTAGPVFDAARSQAFLLAVRRGAAVRDLVRRPDQPSRALLNRWKGERPDFAAELAAAVRFSREVRSPAWARYDEAAADRIIVAVAGGTPLPRVLAGRDLPGPTAVRRWRRLRPDFDHALRTAHRAGHHRRMAARAGLTPQLAGRILVRLTEGATFSEIAEAPGMPHRVTLQAWMRRAPWFAHMVAWGREEGDYARRVEAAKWVEAGLGRRAALRLARLAR